MILTLKHNDEVGTEVGRRADEPCVGLNFCVYVTVPGEIQLYWNLHQGNQLPYIYTYLFSTPCSNR